MHYDPAMWNRHADNVCDDEAVKDAVLAAVDEHPELVLDEMMAAAHVERMVSVGTGVSVAPGCRVHAQASRLLTFFVVSCEQVVAGNGRAGPGQGLGRPT